MMSLEGQLVGMPLAGPESFSQQQLEYLKRALGVDETVLWENASGALSFTTSESINNFERIIIYVKSGQTAKVQAVIIPMCDTNLNGNIVVTWTDNFTGAWHVITFCCSMTRNNNTFTIDTGYYMGVNNSDSFAKGSNNTTIQFFKVIGIHRIAGGNT